MSHTADDEQQLLEPVLLPDFLNRLLYVPAKVPDAQPRLRLWVFLYLVAAPWVWIFTGFYIR